MLTDMLWKLTLLNLGDVLVTHGKLHWRLGDGCFETRLYEPVDTGWGKAAALDALVNAPATVAPRGTK